MNDVNVVRSNSLRQSSPPGSRRHQPQLNAVREYGDGPPRSPAGPNMPGHHHASFRGPQQPYVDNYGHYGEQSTLPRDGTLPRDPRDNYAPHDPYNNTLSRSPRHPSSPGLPPPPAHMQNPAIRNQSPYVNHPPMNDYRGPPRDQRNVRDYRDAPEYGRKPDVVDGRAPGNLAMQGFPPPPHSGPHSPASSGGMSAPQFRGQNGQPPPNGSGMPWPSDPNASLPRHRHDSDRMQADRERVSTPNVYTVTIATTSYVCSCQRNLSVYYMT